MISKSAPAVGILLVFMVFFKSTTQCRTFREDRVFATILTMEVDPAHKYPLLQQAHAAWDSLTPEQQTELEPILREVHILAFARKPTIELEAAAAGHAEEIAAILGEPEEIP